MSSIVLCLSSKLQKSICIFLRIAKLEKRNLFSLPPSSWSSLSLAPRLFSRLLPSVNLNNGLINNLEIKFAPSIPCSIQPDASLGLHLSESILIRKHRLRFWLEPPKAVRLVGFRINHGSLQATTHPLIRDQRFNRFQLDLSSRYIMTNACD